MVDIFLCMKERLKNAGGGSREFCSAEKQGVKIVLSCIPLKISNLGSMMW